MKERDKIEAIVEYIDAKIEYELASIERDEEGYMGSCVEERKATEAALKKLKSVYEEVEPRDG